MTTATHEASPQAGLFDIQEFIRCYQILDIGCRAGMGLNMQGLEAGLHAGKYTLHTSEKSAVITELLNIPEGRTLYFTVAAGDLTECLALCRQIEQKSISEGISRFLIIGRDGWVKALPDYQKAAVVLKKGFS